MIFKTPPPVRYARELEDHLSWLDTFSGTSLGVLAVASGIYTYLCVSSLLDDNRAMSAFAATAFAATAFAATAFAATAFAAITFAAIA